MTTIEDAKKEVDEALGAASKVTQEINQSFPEQLSEFASKTQNSIESFNTLTERFNAISGISDAISIK
jgi:methyl-accepting chemotaxis protein